MAELVEPQVSRYQEYKSTGVEWLPEIPTHWDRVKLKMLVAIKITDGPHETPEFLEEGVTFLSAEAIKINKLDFSARRGFISIEQHEIYIQKNKVEKNDILFCKSGSTTGKSALVETDDVFGIWSPLAIVRANQSISDYKYLFFYMQSIWFRNQVENFWTFGTQPNIGMAALENLWITVPALEEQRAIARFLDDKTAQLDQLITQKQQMLELLREERAALINHAVTKGLDPQAPLRDSGVEWLGEVPAHWEVKRLKHLTVKIGSGVTPKGGAEVYQKAGVPILRSQNIHFDGLRLDDVAFIEEEVHQSMNNSQVLPGDVLLNITGASIGRCYFADETLGEANVNQHVCIVRPNAAISTKFLWAVLSAELGQEQIQTSQNGSGREGLNFENLKKFVIGLPPFQEQQDIMSFVAKEEDKIAEATDTINQEIALLQEYRAALIAEAVTGQLDVRHYTPAPVTI